MNIKIREAFTLIEIVVSIAILSIMMISIVSIYIAVSDISLKSEINRVMQENIKNVVEKIAEDVRTDRVTWVSENKIFPTCSWITSWYKHWTKLCICLEYDENWDCIKSNEYYLAKSDNSWGWIRADISNPWTQDPLDDDGNDCNDINEHCRIILKRKDLTIPIIITNSFIAPITNSFVSVKDLRFSFSNDPVSKITINMEMQPSIGKWIKPDLIKENKLIFQTTISNRPF